jgi:hypothetical protein
MMGLNIKRMLGDFREGERVAIKEGGRTIKGRIVGVFDFFIVVDCGKYKESFSFIKIGLGETQVVKGVR